MARSPIGWITGSRAALHVGTSQGRQPGDQGCQVACQEVTWSRNDIPCPGWCRHVRTFRRCTVCPYLVS